MTNDISIRLATIDDRERMENYSSQNPSAMFVDRWNWRVLIEKTYGLHQYWFIAEHNERIVGHLALTHVKHPLLGNYMATAPYDSYGGISAKNDSIRKQLLESAQKLREELNAEYVLVRHIDGDLIPPKDWMQDDTYATYWINLPEDPQVFWHEHLRAKQRNQIGKSLTQGFQIKFGREDILNDYWKIIVWTMRELGSPYHGKKYLKNMIEILKEDMEFAVIYTPNGKPIGGSLLVYNQSTANHLYANVMRAYRPQCAGDFLYWSVIQHCCYKGIKCFEMGRSLINSNNEYFKMKWLPERKVLGYWYNLKPDGKLPHINQANPKFRLAVRTWQHLPLVITRTIGPYLIQGVL